MDLNQLHFAHPLWLWGGIAIPLIWLVFFLFYRKQNGFLYQLEKFIDSHLLPYLLINNSSKKHSLWKTLLLWSLVWSCLTLAIAGPRWNFRELESFSQDQSLVILLDLSESMNAADIKPSRLIRAQQKIEDLLNLSKGVKIGLIAFAADPHMITPITEDKETIRHLLPSLSTDLVYIQGSRLSAALDMAAVMLEAVPGNNKALLVVSDGGFEDASAIMAAKKLAEKDIVIHVMGIGTTEGAPLYDEKNRASILSKLEKERLGEISKVGNGRYLEVHYSDQEEIIILKELEKRADAQMNIGKKNQFWDERFYVMILPALPILLWWFKRGYLFSMILLLFTAPFELKAINASDYMPRGVYFKNSEELGKQALDAGDYEGAIDAFQDPYRKGIAYYRAKNFAEAEKMFRESSRTDVASSAAYNLGNALVQQQKLKEAITTYEDVLKSWPDHIKAKENLELIKKMLEQQENQGNEEKKQENGQDGQQEKEDGRRDERERNEENGLENEQEEKEDTARDKREGTEEGGSDGQQEMKESKSLKDEEADLWLNRIENDQKSFLKNKFYIESKKNGTKESIDPW